MFVDIWLAIAVGVGMILLLALVIRVLTRVRTNATPPVQHIIDVLKSYAYQGVIAGESYALDAEQQLGVQLDGVDKKAVADQIYDTLPPLLMVGPIPLPIGTVKQFVTRSMFEELVENTYQETKAFLSRNEDFLKSQVDKLKPPVTPDIEVTPNSGVA